MADNDGLPPGLNPDFIKGTKVEESLKNAAKAAGKVSDNLDAANVRAGELSTTLAEASAETARLNAQLKQQPANLVESLKIQEELVSATNRELRAFEAMIRAGVEIGDEERKRLKTLLNIKEEEENILESNEALLKNKNKILENLSKQDEILRRQQRYYNNIDNTVGGTLEKMGIRNEFEDSFLNSLIQSSTGIEGISDGFGRALTKFRSLVNFQEILYKLALETYKAGVDYTKQLFAQSIELNKQIGMARRFRDNLQDTALNSYVLTGGLEGATKAIQGMTTEYSDFTLLSDEVQNSLIETSIKMEMIGVSASDFAKSMQVLTKSMGYSAKEAEVMNIGLTEFASSIGQAPSQMLADFAVAMPKLAVYGQRAEEVFRGLARRSKETGLSIDSLIGVTERMDTFEGAAEAAMQLNSALGGAYFDSTQLLLADEEERLAIIKDTLKAQGIQFNQMGKFEQKMLAQAAGFSNVAEMAAFMNGEMGNTEGGESFNEMVTASADLMVQLKAVFLAAAKPLADSLLPILIKASEALKEFLSNEENLKRTGYAIKAVGMILGAFFAKPIAIAFLLAEAVQVTASSIEAFLEIFNDDDSLGEKVIKFFVGAIGMVLEFMPKLIYKLVATIVGVFSSSLAEAMEGVLKNISLAKAFGGVVDSFFAEDNTPKAAIGTSSSPGGMTIVGERGPEIMNVPRGSQISPASRTADIQTSIESLANAVSKLAAQNGGGNNKPIQVNLTVDGKKLAEAVFNNTSYSDFG